MLLAAAMVWGMSNQNLVDISRTRRKKHRCKDQIPITKHILQRYSCLLRFYAVHLNSALACQEWTTRSSCSSKWSYEVVESEDNAIHDHQFSRYINIFRMLLQARIVHYCLLHNESSIIVNP